ncbi:MAG: hypothetical protein ACFFEN_00050 [Candidatus Thorarchaeota archaeon]
MNSKKTSVLIIIMGFLLFPALFANQNFSNLRSLINTGDGGKINPTGRLFFTQSQNDNNDTTPPSISYIQPSVNKTVITIRTYNIIVEIIDEHSPIPGNVIAELSNLTSFLFNVSMDFLAGDQWIFTWGNLTSYTNYEEYIIRIWAKDSSLNANKIWSIPIYVVVSISPSPRVLNVILYIFLVILIFSGILYYFNKKRAYALPKERKG